jgi:hypothetical protein
VRGAHAATALCVLICAISKHKKPPGLWVSPTAFVRGHKKAASNDCWQACLGGVVALNAEGIRGLGNKYPPPPGDLCAAGNYLACSFFPSLTVVPIKAVFWCLKMFTNA